MNIEDVARDTPELIHKVFIDPSTGLTDAEGEDIARKIGMPEAAVKETCKFMQGLYKAFVETDASLAEINPLIGTGDNRVIALDAKFNFDSNAMYRHPEIQAYRDLDEKENPDEIQASKFDLTYISLDGNIGCMVNGAGLADGNHGYYQTVWRSSPTSWTLVVVLRPKKSPKPSRSCCPIRMSRLSWSIFSAAS